MKNPITTFISQLRLKKINEQLAEIRLYATDIKQLYEVRDATTDPQDKASLDYTITHAIMALEYVTKQLEIKKGKGQS